MTRSAKFPSSWGRALGPPARAKPAGRAGGTIAGLRPAGRAEGPPLRRRWGTLPILGHRARVIEKIIEQRDGGSRRVAVAPREPAGRVSLVRAGRARRGCR